MIINNIIGNPPYQEGNQSIYQHFINTSIKLNIERICMIVKRNWFTGNTLKETRDNMIDYGLKDIIDYTEFYEIFPQVHSTVAIFNLVRDYKDKCRYTQIVNGGITAKSELNLKIGENILVNEERTIIDKVTKHNTFEQWSLSKNTRIFSIGSNGYFMYSTYTEDIIKYSDMHDDKFNTTVFFLDGAKNVYKRYTERNKLPKGEEYIDKYKVICGSKAQDNKTVISNIHVLKPGEIMTNSFSIIGIVDSEEYANKIAKYAKTKFFRSLVKFAIAGDKIIVGDGALVYVPMIHNLKDIDFSLNTSDIDKQLYKKYELDEAEIRYIENLVN